MQAYEVSIGTSNPLVGSIYRQNIMTDKTFKYYVSKTTLSLLVIITLSSCSSIRDARSQKAPYMKLYYSGEIKDAAKELTVKANSRSGTGDELMWRLDEGTADFTASEFNKSVKVFEKCENILKDYDERAEISARDGGAEISSTITNPNSIPYKGMYIDIIMLNAYKALNYFAIDDFSGAQVELRRMRYAQANIVKKFNDEIEKEQKSIDAANLKNQQETNHFGGANSSITFDSIVKNSVINEAYTSSKQRSNKLYGALSNPFITYFSAIGYLINNDYSEALVDFRNLYKMLPNNKLVQRDYITAAKAISDKIPDELKHIKSFNYPLTNKIVYIILFNGRAPALKQRKFQIILPYVGYTGVAFPQYEYFSSELNEIEVNFLHNKQNKTERTVQIADFDAIMSQEYHRKLPTMITRIVISTLTKELASYMAVHAAKQAGTGAEIGAYALTGIYKALFNTADTRCWETLPQEVQITHIPIPDNRKFTLRSITSNAKIINQEPRHKHRKINPTAGNKEGNSSKKEIKHSNEIEEIKLKNDTNVAIVYIRALSADKIIYKLFETK